MPYRSVGKVFAHGNSMKNALAVKVSLSSTRCERPNDGWRPNICHLQNSEGKKIDPDHGLNHHQALFWLALLLKKRHFTLFFRRKAKRRHGSLLSQTCARGECCFKTASNGCKKVHAPPLTKLEQQANKAGHMKIDKKAQRIPAIYFEYLDKKNIEMH